MATVLFSVVVLSAWMGWNGRWHSRALKATSQIVTEPDTAGSRVREPAT